MIEDILLQLKDEDKIKEYRSIPFWSWNGKLENKKLENQIGWMHEQGFGGYFMHARGGLSTEYLGDEWFQAVETCINTGDKLKMQSWAYDENGWPSGFVGGKLLEDISNRDMSLTYKIGKFDKDAFVSYLITAEKINKVDKEEKDGEYLNVYKYVNTSTVDILNPDVTDKFISLTHKEYKERLGEKFNSLKGFFTDEPQYYRWGQPFTEMIAKAYKQTFNEDITEKLGLIFLKKEGYREFRYWYWKTMQELMLNNHSARVYDWCEKNGVKLTGHYVEENTLYYQLLACGGIMPFYEYLHIPGIDNLGRKVPNPIVGKQVSSVARQTGKKKVLTETFACCGWDVTPVQLKIIAEGQYVNGANLMCEHLLPYSEHGQRKRDYPAHFSAVNPWVKQDFKTFNDYFARLGYLLAESQDIVSVALFCPVRSIYFDYERYDFDAKNIVNESYCELAKKLADMNINFHIIDETLMKKYAKVVNDKLVVGNCSYDYIVFPEVVTLDKSTANLFDEYYANGGKMCFTGSIFSYLEGKEFNYLYNSNISLKEIAEKQPYTVDKFDTEIHSTYRQINGKKFIYATNTSFDKKYIIRYSGNFNGFIKLDLETLTEKTVDTEVELGVGESAILFLTNDNPIYKLAKKEIISFDGPFNIINSDDNFLLLDKLSYSFDGVNYSEPLRYMGVFNELLNLKHNGQVYLKYSFSVKEIPSQVQFLAEENRIISLQVNGQPVSFSARAKEEDKLLVADISSFLKLGENYAVLKIDFYESQHVYNVLFGENIDESLKNCLSYDTTIEPCFLKGDFGVYSDCEFKKGKEKNVYIGDNFYISKKKHTVDNLIKDGYPFFAGRIRLCKTFELENNNVLLELKGNYCLAYDLKINGVKIDKSYFSNVIDISHVARIGVNTIEITLCSSNRNLLGPHHLKDYEETFDVGPYSYELKGTWINGKSNKERENYSFVRFGLFTDLI